VDEAGFYPYEGTDCTVDGTIDTACLKTGGGTAYGFSGLPVTSGECARDGSCDLSGATEVGSGDEVRCAPAPAAPEDRVCLEFLTPDNALFRIDAFGARTTNGCHLG
jgi:hypothetical protein